MFSIVCVASCKAVAFMLTALSKEQQKKNMRHTKNQNQYRRDTQVHRVTFNVWTYEIHLIEIEKRAKNQCIHMAPMFANRQSNCRTFFLFIDCVCAINLHDSHSARFGSIMCRACIVGIGIGLKFNALWSINRFDEFTSINWLDERGVRPNNNLHHPIFANEISSFKQFICRKFEQVFEVWLHTKKNESYSNHMGHRLVR